MHHLRKAEAEDPFDAVSGSTSLTDTADSTLKLGDPLEAFAPRAVSRSDT